MKEKLIKITNIVHEKMKKYDYVLPNHYKILFNATSLKFNVNLEAVELNSTVISKKVRNQADQLEDNIENAVVAIKEHDETKLKIVLEETKKLKEEVQMLRDEIYTDALTKIYNRKWFYDNYLTEDELNLTKEGHIVIIDMNDFKIINDNHGHTAGDKVLFYISNQLKLSGGDIIRYGGDEFIIIFDNLIDINTIQKTITNIQKEVMSKKFRIKEKIIQLSFSFGLATFQKNDLLEDIMDLADKNMYKNKKYIKGIN